MGQQSVSTLDLSFQAAGAVMARRAVGYNGAQASQQGQRVLGISPRPAADKTYSDATVSGTAIVEAGEAFPIGSELIVDTQGRAILKRNRPVGGLWSGWQSTADFINPEMEHVFANALEAAAAQGEFVEVLLRR